MVSGCHLNSTNHALLAMARDLERIESKLQALVTQAECPICRDRERCPSCGSPAGDRRRDHDEIMSILQSRFDELADGDRKLQQTIEALSTSN